MHRFAISFLLLFTVTPLFAQTLNERLKQLPTPAKQLEFEAMQRVLCRTVWNGNGSYLPLWIAFSNKKGEDLGLTPAQIEKLDSWKMHREFEQKKQSGDPEVAAALKAMQDARPKDDPELLKADAKQKQKFLDAAIRIPMLQHGKMQSLIEETLTPEQMRKARALELQMMAGAGFPNPGMFEALNLSPDQKAKMAAIRKNADPEFEKFLDGVTDITKEQNEMVREILERKFRDAADIPQDEWNKALMEANREAAESDRIKKLQADNADQGLALAARYQFDLMEVLTDEQVDEMQKLLDNKPEFVKNLIDAIEKHRAKMKESGQWQPGLDSWSPGDGAPAEFKRRKAGKAFPQQDQ